MFIITQVYNLGHSDILKKKMLDNIFIFYNLNVAASF